MSDIKNKLLKSYAKLAKTLGHYPSIADLEKIGITRNAFRHHFHTHKEFKDLAKEAYPDSFKEVIDETRFNEDILNKLQSDINKHKRFVITTAVAGCVVNTKFYDSIKNYCKLKNAMLLILPADNKLQELDKDLVSNENIVFGDIKLNNNLSISPIKVAPRQIDPVTGLKRLVHQKGTSLIFASPKQRMMPVCTSNIKIPRVLMATGAITEAKYNNRKHVNRRIDYLGDLDHVIGALVVEIRDKELYHFRQLQFIDDCFIDLGVEYHPNKTKKTHAEGFVLGDYHSGETDPKADQAWSEVCDMISVKYQVLHDFFNGLSINHHEEENKILLADRVKNGENNLTKELIQAKRDLDKLKKRSKHIVVTKSNHDEFLDRWVRECKYIEDPVNHLIGHKLAGYMLEGQDPLKAGVELFGYKTDEKTIWLDRDSDFYISGFQCANHGDRGGNGKRNPGIRGLEECYGKVIFGHRHFFEILRGAVGVGTSSLLKLSYNAGASAWVHSSCLVYPNGSFQLINAIEGLWRLED